MLILMAYCLTGHYGMEIVVALLLIVTLTAATPLRPTHRSVTEHQRGQVTRETHV